MGIVSLDLHDDLEDLLDPLVVLHNLGLHRVDLDDLLLELLVQLDQLELERRQTGVGDGDGGGGGGGGGGGDVSWWWWVMLVAAAVVAVVAMVVNE